MNQRLTLFLLIWAGLLGAYARFAPAMQADFPINDGGLFYTMSEDLLANGFRLPAITSYNHLNIPFAYPPAGIYLVAFLQKVSSVQLPALFIWLPAIISLLTLPIFYLLARELLDSAATAALATAIFALLPRAFKWTVMGGGMTRAPGLLLLLLFVYCLYRAFHRGGIWPLVGAMLSGALVVLTHPERALHAAGTACLLWFFLGRSRSGTLRAFFLAGGVVLLSAPWWITMLVRYGMTPFLNAGGAGGGRLLFWVAPLQADFSSESIPLVSILVVLGTFGLLLRKDFFLPAWLVFAYLLEPRSAPHIIAVQASLLAAVGLAEVVFPSLARISGVAGQAETRWEPFVQSAWAGKLILGYVLLIGLVNMMVEIPLQAELVLPREERQAMEWVSTHTPPESRFLIIGWRSHPMLSPELEWFPALTGRMSVVTAQGREWLAGPDHYTPHLQSAQSLQACYHQGLDCLKRWEDGNQADFDNIYLSLDQRENLLYLSLKQAGYPLIYETEKVKIFSMP